MLAEAVAGDDLEPRAGLYDVRHPLVVREIKVPVGRYRRGAMMRAEALGPRAVAGLRFQATRETVVFDVEEVVTPRNRRRHVSGAARVSPSDVRTGHVARAVRPDREHVELG